MERIGILLVHGIGDQGRFQHLQNVVERFVRDLSKERGHRDVSVDMPGVSGDATVILRRGDDLVALEFTEMWWRDLGQRPSFFAKLGFWLWAISLPGTKGYFERPTDGRFSLGNRFRSIGWKARLGLLLRTTYIFVLLSPLAMILRLVNLIPGIRTIPFMHSIFTYLSSVQLYQQRPSAQRGTLVDYDQSRRVSIQRRMANMIMDMSERGYDRWYIFGHSLGSVIAFKALMYDGVAFARFMSFRRWNQKTVSALQPSPDHEAAGIDQTGNVLVAQDARSFSETEALVGKYVDCPRCPAWLAPTASLDTAKIFARLRGFVSYGSPLETFAETWPAIIELNKSLKLPEDFEWINLYDPTDVVAPKLTSFLRSDDAKTVFVPNNVPVDSSFLLGRSHINYFAPPTETRRHRAISHLNNWILNGGQAFENIIGSDRLEEDHVTKRYVAMGLQAFGILIVGGLLWPIATLSALSVIGYTIGGFLLILSRAINIFVRVDGEQMRRVAANFIDSAGAFIDKLNPTDDWIGNLQHVGTIYAIIAAVVAIASAAHYARDWLQQRRDQSEKADTSILSKQAPTIRLGPADAPPSATL